MEITINYSDMKFYSEDLEKLIEYERLVQQLFTNQR